MNNTLLFQLLKTLSNLDLKHVGLWLNSPFFNKREQPALLLEYLINCLNSKTEPERDEAIRYIFEEHQAVAYKRKALAPAAVKPAHEQALRLISSELLGHIEDFLAYNEVFRDKSTQPIYLSAVYRKKGLEKHFHQSIQTARNSWERQPYRHTEYFDAQVQIEYERYQYLSNGRRTESLNLQELSTVTDTAYIARKLRQVCFALTHQNVYKAEYEFGLLPAVLNFVGQSPDLLQTPAVCLYYYCYWFLTEPDNEMHFMQFKTALFEYTGQLPVDEQRNLHLLALNYCIKKINQLNEPYNREALDLYKSALRGELLIENGVLSHFAFNNIVAIALRTHETDWATAFIHQYAAFLEKKHRDATFHLNLARVAYVSRKYRDALLHLQEADYKDLINNLIAKTLQLKIFYETGELDTLDAHLQSMQTFIRRQRVIGYHKTNYLNIIKFTRQLTRVNLNSKSEKNALREKIKAETTLTEKEWLLSML